jgi:hypothetical protein
LGAQRPPWIWFVHVEDRRKLAAAGWHRSEAGGSAGGGWTVVNQVLLLSGCSGRVAE